MIWIIKFNPPVDFLHFPWFGVGSPVHGTRRALATCGDGQLDPGEFCDDGAGNGTDGCCTAFCTLIDTDGDGACDTADDCPTIFDPLQSCAVPLTLTSARVSASGRARLRGTMSQSLGSFSEATVRVATANVSRTLSCTGKAPDVSMRCKAADGTLRLRLKRPTPADAWSFQAAAQGLTLAPLAGPVQMEVVDRSNSRVASGQLTTCSVIRTRLVCGP